MVISYAQVYFLLILPSSSICKSSGPVKVSLSAKILMPSYLKKNKVSSIHFATELLLCSLLVLSMGEVVWLMCLYSW